MKTVVTLLRGDGIGPEVVDAAVRAIEATGAEIEWEPRDAGAGAIPKHGAPLPETTLESIRRTRLCLKGPLATPIGGGYASVNVALRREFDLYANVRPARTSPGGPGGIRGGSGDRPREHRGGIRRHRALHRSAPERGRGHLDHHPARLRPHHPFRLRVRARQRAQADHAGAQGEHPEDDLGLFLRSGGRSPPPIRTSGSTTSSSTRRR